jgi:hypothetical protein
METKINAEREQYQEAKAKFSGKNIGLNRTEVESILNDSSLTWDEKEAKIRILTKDKLRGNQINMMNVTNRGETARGEMINNSAGEEKGKGPRKESVPESPKLGNKEKEERDNKEGDE